MKEHDAFIPWGSQCKRNVARRNHRFVRSFVRSVGRWFVRSLVRSLVGSLVRWFVGSFVPLKPPYHDGGLDDVYGVEQRPVEETTRTARDHDLHVGGDAGGVFRGEVILGVLKDSEIDGAGGKRVSQSTYPYTCCFVRLN